MQSNNPVFRRSAEFNGRNAYGNQTYAGNGQAHAGYATDPYAQPGYGAPQGYQGYGAPGQSGERRMTIDSVVQKTGLTLVVAVVAAAATWFLVGPVDNNQALGTMYGLAMIGGLGAFALSLVNSFKRVISPALVIAFAVLEGIFLGAFSKGIDLMVYQNTGQHDVVPQAVLGTFAAFAGTLAAYKFFNIQVGARFRAFVMASVLGMVALGVLELVLSMFGNAFGFFGFGTLGLVFAVFGLVLGVFMLILDFDFVEHGVAAGLPERESWRAAFALTVSLVWIYTNLLRILAIFSQD